MTPVTYWQQYSICYFCKVANTETEVEKHANTRHCRCRQDSHRPVVQGDSGQHPARDADHHGAAGGRSPVRCRPGGHRRPHLRRIALRRRRSRALRGRRDRHAGRSRPVGEPALRGQPDRDRQRVRPDRVRHGARAHRRWCAVAFDDAADELAHPRPRAEVRGAVDAADPRRDARRADEGHVDHRRLEHRAGGWHHP